jgi:hypothetical protein
MEDLSNPSESAGYKVTDYDLNPLINVLQLGNQVASKTAETVTHAMVQGGRALLHKNITYLPSSAATLVMEGDGYLVSVSVVVPCTTSSLAGFIYDAASVALASASNAIIPIESSGFHTYNFPFSEGLVVRPSSLSGHLIAVSYVERHI